MARSGFALGICTSTKEGPENKLVLLWIVQECNNDGANAQQKGIPQAKTQDTSKSFSPKINAAKK